MKDQIVSFKTAKLAKEKEFDISCLQAYSVWRGNIRKGDKHPLQDIDVEYEPYMGGVNSSVEYYNQSKQYTLAPTQSLLQKFLREKHGIHIEISINDNGFYFGKIYHILSPDRRCNVISFYTTFEDSLEDGLYQALKLIKL